MTFVGSLHSKVIPHSTAFVCGQAAGCLVMVGRWAQGVGAACCWCVRTASYRYVCAGHPWCLGFPCFALFGCGIASLCVFQLCYCCQFQGLIFPLEDGVAYSFLMC